MNYLFDEVVLRADDDQRADRATALPVARKLLLYLQLPIYAQNYSILINVFAPFYFRSAFCHAVNFCRRIRWSHRRTIAPSFNVARSKFILLFRIIRTHTYGHERGPYGERRVI